MNASGNLVNASGDVLLGRGADGNGALVPVNVSAIGGTARATENVSVGANLPASASAGEQYTLSVQATDSLGQPQDVDLTFTAGAALGTYDLTIPGARENTAAGPAYSETLSFGGDGQLSSGQPADVYIAGTNGAADLTIQLDVSGLTRYAGDFTPGAISADGARFGQVTGVQVAPNGTLSATFDNGEVVDVATIPVATFVNASGLEAACGGAYRATDASGEATYRTGGQGGAGTVQGGALELSTTDLGAEFVNQILAQNAYSASLKTIAAAQDMSRDLMDLKG